MTPDELTALLEKATPGPWSVKETWTGGLGNAATKYRDVWIASAARSDYLVHTGDRLAHAGGVTLENPSALSDARLMAALRNLAPLLIDLWRAAYQAISNGKWEARGNLTIRSHNEDALQHALHLLAEHTEEDEP